MEVFHRPSFPWPKSVDSPMAAIQQVKSSRQSVEGSRPVSIVRVAPLPCRLLALSRYLCNFSYFIQVIFIEAWFRALLGGASIRWGGVEGARADLAEVRMVWRCGGGRYSLGWCGRSQGGS